MYTYQENFADFIKARDLGEKCEINEEMYDYFLEVLPPCFMSRAVVLCDGSVVRADFGFAEGAEVATAFWRKGNKFFAQKIR